ncbi:MAG: c-type cytochrome [Planctomycetia bacterium]|nr:c-type cytochrome [Planctomycetia bacterium]
MPRGVILLALAATILTPVGLARAGDPPPPSGRELFERKWPTTEQNTGPGDGLGPMYNSRSCVGCHDRGGIGGAGRNEHNVDLLTVIDTGNAAQGANASRVAKLAKQIHPAFASAATITIHRFGTEAEYDPYRSNLLALRDGAQLRLTTESGGLNKVRIQRGVRGKKPVLEVGQLVLQRSQRNTPSLFGAGMIDHVSDDAMKQFAAGQPEALRGRVAGRFGWRGQTTSLLDFVQGACANELGLQTPQHAQSPDPTQPEYLNGGADMTPEELGAMVSFVEGLPAPPRLQPVNKQDAAAQFRGAALFTSIQCANCHAPNLGEVKGLYSDLLVHDMGESLSDPVGSPSLGNSSSTFPGAPYYGASSAELARLWRTPPLWGVRDSGPYLHDGRAATLEIAIRLHDGQGKQAAKKFQSLERTQREDVLAFVKSLGAP